MTSYNKYKVLMLTFYSPFFSHHELHLFVFRDPFLDSALAAVVSAATLFPFAVSQLQPEPLINKYKIIKKLTISNS